MRHEIVRSRTSVWWCAALSLLLAAFFALPAGAAVPFPFEDVNGNGQWDLGIDNDLTEVLKPNEWFTYYHTPFSIVIPAGVFLLRSSKAFTGYYLEADGNITVNSNITSTIYAGDIHLKAGGDVVIGPKVVLNARDYVSAYAGGNIVVGAGAAFQSMGGSANLGTISFWAGTGSITFTGAARFTTLREIFINAVAGDVTSDSGLKLSASLGSFMVSGRKITMNKGTLRANDINITAGGVPLQFKYNRVTIPKTGYFDIDNRASTVDITGTIVPKYVSVNIAATQIIK